MKLTIEVEEDAEGLAWIWAQWLYENSSIPRMPESMTELCRQVKELMRSWIGDHPHIPYDMITDTLESQMTPKTMDEFVEELMKHIEGFPEWKEVR